MKTPPQKTEIICQNVREVAQNAFEYTFSHSLGDIPVEPGQFAMLFVPLADTPLPRAYSLLDFDEKILKLCIKILPDGRATPWIHKNLKTDTKIDAMIPLGDFTLPENLKNKKLTFICTGTGISPLLFMSRANPTAHIDFWLGVRTQKDILLEKELTKITENNPNFSFHITLSREETKNYKTGRITNHIDKMNHDSHFFICGSGPMIEETKLILRERNISPEKIHSERFF